MGAEISGEVSLDDSNPGSGEAILREKLTWPLLSSAFHRKKFLLEGDRGIAFVGERPTRIA
jgi:hypothetical protein